MTKGKAKKRVKSTSSDSKEKVAKAAKKSEEKITDADPVAMRRRVKKIVDGQLNEITDAAVGEARKGQLATVKYLFEVVGLYPPAAEGIMDRPEEDTFTQRIVRRLGLAEGPLASSEDDVPAEKLAIPMDESISTDEKGGEELSDKATQGKQSSLKV